jgi:Ca2+-binding EF-hand superfamily protein
MTTKSTQQQQMPNYRIIFQSYNALGDGRLSRSDFQRLLSTNQINFTNTELSKIIQRLDVNKDGIVDYADFLRFVTGVCDAAVRRAQRVASAAENLKAWAMEEQNKKLAKDGQIDSSASWKLLRPKRGLLDISSVDHILRERGIRLETDKLRLLRVIMAPSKNGEIDQAAYHAFVNHQPRKVYVKEGAVLSL